MWALADVTVTGAEPVTVALTMIPAMTVTGQVVFEGTTPPPADLSTVRILFLPLPDSGARIEDDIVVNPSGAFSISGVIPGRYRITATVPSGAAPPAWTLRSATMQGQDVTDLPLVVAPGSAPAVTVTLSDQLGELSGTVTDGSGKPATDYFVIAIPDNNRYWIPGSRRIVSTRPDVSGQYHFRGLPDGAYRIAATTDLVQRDLSDVSTLAQIAEHATPVTIGIAEKKIFNLQVGR